MATKIERTHDYGKNMDNCGKYAACVVCGRPIKNANAPMIHVNIDWEAITDEEYEANPDYSQGGWPIGSDCLRQHPELRPYAQGGMSR